MASFSQDARKKVDSQFYPDVLQKLSSISKESNVINSKLSSSSVMCVSTSSGGKQSPDSSKKMVSDFGGFPTMFNPYDKSLYSERDLLHSETCITVPFGWKRVISSSKVLYISPSEVFLYSLEELAVYLQTEGTCKCGLECPLLINKVFNFNPMAASKSWNIDNISWNDPTKLCFHKRKIAALATFCNSTLNPSGRKPYQSVTKKDICFSNKRKKLKSKRNPFDSILVSQLLAQRDKLGQRKNKPGAIKQCLLENSNTKITSQNVQKFESVSNNQCSALELTKSYSSTSELVLEDKTSLLSEMNNSSNLNSFQLNSNCYIPNVMFQDKKVQPIHQFTSDSSSALFHKQVCPQIPPCISQDNMMVPNSRTIYNERVPPLPSVDQQMFGGSTLQQGLFNSQQFSQNNITLNCSFSSMAGEVFNAQLPCMDPQVQPTSVSQPCTPSALLYSSGPQGRTVANVINSCCAQKFVQLAQNSTSSYAPLKDDPRPRMKKSGRAKINKINSVLDRGSPCPNIDVRQIPKEHHRPQLEAFASIASSSILQNSNYPACQPYPTEFIQHPSPSKTLLQPGVYEANRTLNSCNDSSFQSSPISNKNGHSSFTLCQDTLQSPHATGVCSVFESKNQNKPIYSVHSKVSVPNQFHSNGATIQSLLSKANKSSPSGKTPVGISENKNSYFVGNHCNTTKVSQNSDSKQSNTLISSSVYMPLSNINNSISPSGMSFTLCTSTPSVSNTQSSYNQSLQPNVPVSHQNALNTVYSHQNIPSQQGITMTQQPLVFNNGVQNQRPANFFMQNSATRLDGLTKPLLQHDNSSMLVQQVLNQKITSDFSSSNVFSSTARGQVLQQMSGMVLPVSAANSQQLILAPHMRMAGSGGLITMLPSSMTSNGTVLTANTQSIEPQMVLSENLRHNLVSQQQLIQNNCFIMSNSPAFVTRPPTSIVPCPPSASLSFSTSQTANTYSPIITSSVTSKAESRNNPLQVNNEISTQTLKDSSFASGLHLQLPTQQRYPLQKTEDLVQNDNWLPKTELKTIMNDDVARNTFIASVSQSNSVPSNAMCRHVLINGDSVDPQNPNTSRMTSVIPLVGGQCAPMPPLSIPNVTAVTTTMAQMIPAIGIAPQILGQPVQPMVQVINTVPFNSMQNTVLVPSGSNVLQQTVHLEALQTSPVVGTTTQAVFNGVVIPPNQMNCINSPLKLSQQCNANEETRMTFENMHDTRAGSHSSCSTPASSCSSTPTSIGDGHSLSYCALSPATRKRNRDGKRKANSQTVASMLQNGAHSVSLSSTSSSNTVCQQQHNTTQMSVQQQFLQSPVLQTLTVLPQQPRPLLHQPVMNYNGQILTTSLASPLGIVQPLGMLGVTPVIQNIPVQQVMSGTHFQSLTVLPPEQPVIVNETSSMGIHPTQMHSAFTAGSIVPNMVTANPVINADVGGNEMMMTTSQSLTLKENGCQTSTPNHFASMFQQAIPPVAQPLSSSTSGKPSRFSSAATTLSLQISTSNFHPVSACAMAVGNGNSFLQESKQKGRSIGVQSSCTEQNTASQTVTSSTVPVNISLVEDKLCVQDSKVDVKSKLKSETSSTLLSSGGESCESPWPDPVNLSAAVRAVVQEQFDSNEELIPQSIRSLNPVITFLDCNLQSEPAEQANVYSSIAVDNSVLDLRTVSLEVTIGESKDLREWRESPDTHRHHPTERASTASSDSSEPTSTDCNVTSDSGVESSQEPMNLACIRDNTDKSLTDMESAIMSEGDKKLIKKQGTKRLKSDLEMPYKIQEEESNHCILLPQPRTFNDGDLVWGQIRGVPSWPGKLVREEEVKGTPKKEDGKLWVKWFGDHTFTQVDPQNLKTLSEGLEAHHRARKKHRRGRKMNPHLENAIQEAMLDLDHQSADLLTDEDPIFSTSLDCGEVLPIKFKK